jgi:outer membrane protein assembly factor BamE (lipoprotein component of BamABCDE complex)
MKIKIFIIFICLLTLVSCYQKNAIEGNFLLEDNLVQLKTGLTKSQVFNLFGAPTIASSFGENTWLYVSEVYDRTFSFSGKKITGYQGLYIVFDSNNIVANISFKDMKDRKQIKINSKQTKLNFKGYPTKIDKNEVFNN